MADFFDSQAALDPQADHAAGGKVSVADPVAEDFGGIKAAAEQADVKTLLSTSTGAFIFWPWPLSWSRRRKMALLLAWRECRNRDRRHFSTPRG